jgi:NADH-quinone oxidoreductase subunit K
MRVGLEFFIWLSAGMFVLGLYGALSKRSVVLILMSLELMANAINLNLVAMSRFVTPDLMTGQFFAVFLMVVAAAEIGLGLGLVLALYRQTNTIEVELLDKLKG